MVDTDAGNDGDGRALPGQMVDKRLFMALAALDKGLQARVIAEWWLDEFAPGDLQIKVRKITTIKMSNEVSCTEDDLPTTVLHPPPRPLPKFKGPCLRNNDTGLQKHWKDRL